MQDIKHIGFNVAFGLSVTGYFTSDIKYNIQEHKIHNSNSLHGNRDKRAGDKGDRFR